MSVFNYYSNFIKKIGEEKNIDEDVGQYLITSDSNTKAKLCDKIFNLLIEECTKYYNRLTDERKAILDDWLSNNIESENALSFPKNGVYKTNPFTGGRLYVNSDVSDDDRFFCLLNSYDFNVEFNKDYEVILYPVGSSEGYTYYDVGLVIVNNFIDNINDVKNDCLSCCDNFYTLSKCFVMYKMIGTIKDTNKVKEFNFYLKYIVCVLEKYTGFVVDGEGINFTAKTTDDEEQRAVIFDDLNPDPDPDPNPKPDPDPDPDPDPEPDDQKDNIRLRVDTGGDTIFCIINENSEYVAELRDGEVILSNLKHNYVVKNNIDNDYIIILR